MCKRLSERLLRDGEFIIFSVDREDRHAYRNQTLRSAVGVILQEREIPFARVTGSYKGVMEVGFMIPYSIGNLMIASDIAAVMGQESVFVKNGPTDACNECWLYYTEQQDSGLWTESLGVWCEVETDTLHDYDGWTNVGHRYFTTVEVD